MEENPYSEFVGIMQEDREEAHVDAWRLGEVVGLSPLQIQTAGQMLQGDDIYVNYQLVENEERVTLTDPMGVLLGSVDCSLGGQISQMEVSGGEIEADGTFHGVLEIGDQVALLQSHDGQRFVVLCKVVSA